LFHLEENHGTDFLRGKLLSFAKVINFYQWRTLSIINNGERPLFSILDDFRIVESSTDETSKSAKSENEEILCVKDGISWVESSLILCSVTDQSFTFGESDVRRRYSVSLIVGNDFNICIICPHSAAGIRRSKIDAT
jgi:NAD-specific glutamate dehydrogenase